MSETLLGLNRDQLAKALGGNYSVIRAFEQIVNDVGGFPSTVEEANALAGSALAVAQTALESLTVLMDLVSQIDGAPATVAPEEVDDTMPRAHVGTLGAQNADTVEITGGTIDGTAIGPTTQSTGSFTTLDSSGITRLNKTSGQTLIGTTFASSGNGKLQVREDGNEYIVSFKNAASKEWVFGAYGGGMYLTNATDGRKHMQPLDTGETLIMGGGLEGMRIDTGQNAFFRGAIAHNSSVLMRSTAGFSNGAGTSAATLNNAPVAGDPTKWVTIDDAGVLRRIPSW